MLQILWGGGLSSNLQINPQGFTPTELNNIGKKSRSKWVTWAIITVILVIAGAIIGIFVLKNNQMIQNRELAIEEFINYMLFGGDNEGETGINGLMLEDTYFVNMAGIGVYEEQRDFFAKAKEKLDEIKRLRPSEELVGLINRLKTMLMVFEKKSEMSYTDVLLRKYLEDGQFGIEEYINDFGGVDAEEDIWLNNLYDVVRLLADKSQELFERFTKAGCIKNQELSSDCATTIVDDDVEVEKIQNQVDSLRGNVRDTNDSVAKVIFDDILILKNGVDNE